MTPRDRFIAALDRQPLTGRVPHFELVFFLTMEAFGKVHPSHRSYHQWDQMEEKEHRLHREDMADLFIATAERFDHSAIFLHPNPGTPEESMRLVDLVREKTGDKSLPDPLLRSHFLDPAGRQDGGFQLSNCR